MIQQTEPLTLLELVDRIKEKSNDTLLSTISANGGSAKIHSIAPLETAGFGEVAFLANSKYRDAARDSKATALVLTEEDKKAIWGEDEPERILVVTRNPYAWFALALQVMFPQVKAQPGIDARSVVEEGAEIDESATVEAGAVIRKGSQDRCPLLYRGQFRHWRGYGHRRGFAYLSERQYLLRLQNRTAQYYSFRRGYRS